MNGTEECYSCHVKACSPNEMLFEFNSTGGLLSETNCSTTQCYNSTERYNGCEGGQGCLTTDCTGLCSGTSKYTNCTNGTGCSGLVDCTGLCNGTRKGTNCTSGSCDYNINCENQCDGDYRYTECSGGSCVNASVYCPEQCINTSHRYSNCTNGSGCTGSVSCGGCYNSTHIYECINGTGCGVSYCGDYRYCNSTTNKCELNCSCDATQQNYLNVTINGDTVYIDCNYDKCWTPTQGTFSWGDADNHCDNLVYAGSGGWTLPDDSNLTDLCQSNSCAGTCFGGEGVVDVYWTSRCCPTALYDGTSYAIDFSDCSGAYYNWGTSLYVRCFLS